MGLERIVDQVGPFHVAGRVEALEAGDLLGLADSFIVHMAGPLFLLDLEVDVPLERRAIRSASAYFVTSSNAGPEMISGVRASSIKMLSTSSMIA